MQGGKKEREFQLEKVMMVREGKLRRKSKLNLMGGDGSPRGEVYTVGWGGGVGMRRNEKNLEHNFTHCTKKKGVNIIHGERGRGK